MIDRLVIDRIFAAADIVEVVSDFLTLKRKGTNFTACCPFHNEKTPSFMVSPAKGLYKCFGCGKGGNAVSFVMEHEKLSYPEALRWMAKKYNIEIQEKTLTQEQQAINNDRESMMVLNSWAADYFQHQMSQTPQGNDVALSYFRERGFSDQSINRFGLGYCPDRGDAMSQAAIQAGFQEVFLEKTGLSGQRERGGLYDRFHSRVIFPIHSLSGRVIGFGGRTLRSDKKVSKYLNSPESEIYHKSSSLYGLFFAKKAINQLDRCILVEGYTDVIQMHQAGIENVVSSSGTALTEDQIKLIKRFSSNITVIYDGDSAGIKASMRGIDMILQQGLTVRCVLLPDGEDPDSFAKNHNSTYLKQYLVENEVDFITFKTKLLLEGTQKDPLKRAELISDIVSTIALIQDGIQRQVFVVECSRLMDIREDILNIEVERKRLGSVNGREWYESVRPKPVESQVLSTQDTVSENNYIKELAVLELEILGYLLKYSGQTFDLEVTPTEVVSLNVVETIINELVANDVEFMDPLYKRIYKEFISTTPYPDLNYFINHADQQIATFATNVIFNEETYQVSSMWSHFEIHISTEKDRLPVAIPKSITIYLLKVLNYKFSELQASIPQTTEPEMILKIWEQMAHLNALRTQICEKYDRTV